MNSTARKYSIFLVLWALSALYISIGSLVHFHQYKIYGTKLVSEVVISKRENEISVKDTDAGSDFQTGSPAVVTADTNIPRFHFATLVAYGPGVSTVHSCCLSNSGLRAPPLA